LVPYRVNRKLEVKVACSEYTTCERMSRVPWVAPVKEEHIPPEVYAKEEAEPTCRLSILTLRVCLTASRGSKTGGEIGETKKK